jgi:RNA polymerase sigma factor (sigma-70 family)
MATRTIDRCARRPAGDAVRARPTAPADDGELRRRFRDGDPDALGELYERFAGPLLSLSRSELGDVEQARDAVQQTFLRAWRSAGTFDAERPLGPWLFQICRRVCVDTYRRQRARLEPLDDHEHDPALTIAGPSLERSSIVWEVRQAIDALPSESREIIRLRHLDGWTVEQVAAVLGLPVGTVKSRSFRAHKQLLASLTHLRAADGEQAA